ncbi:hypothetical protein C8J57DRAFT_1568030, partial [Mycena rebaudengoi]
SPFDGTGGGDIILRSLDSLDFHVHRLALSAASPVLRSMFCLPQPMDEPAVPIIHVQESGSLLDRVLRFWYPGTQPDIANLSQLREVLQILIFKYDIEFVAYSGKKHLREYIPTDAVAVFAIAGHHQWRDIAIAAAMETLALPLHTFDDDPSPELLHITAKMYHNLLRYHSQCGKTA